MIATLKNVPLASFSPSETMFHMLDGPCLLVDDSVSGGETMREWTPFVPKATTFAVFIKPQSPKPDIWLEEVPGARVFEWNWHKHHYLRKAVLDIDGVLCDDGDGYDVGHIQRAEPLFLPDREVLAIATGRKECHRQATEEWLLRHGVRYKKLYMSTDERGAIKTKCLAAKETGATWVVESSLTQAEKIFHHTGLPVLCTDHNEMINGPLKFL
jgi:hypothetical protein